MERQELGQIIDAQTTYHWSERYLIYLTIAEHVDNMEELIVLAEVGCGFDLIHDMEFWEAWERYGAEDKEIKQIFKDWLRTGNRGTYRGAEEADYLRAAGAARFC